MADRLRVEVDGATAREIANGRDVEYVVKNEIGQVVTVVRIDRGDR
jgi:hypothetical protein